MASTYLCPTINITILTLNLTTITTVNDTTSRTNVFRPHSSTQTQQKEKPTCPHSRALPWSTTNHHLRHNRQTRSTIVLVPILRPGSRAIPSPARSKHPYLRARRQARRAQAQEQERPPPSSTPLQPHPYPDHPLPLHPPACRLPRPARLCHLRPRPIHSAAAGPRVWGQR